jgi:hypothetical protein
MTVERTGLAAGVALDAPTLEAEIITALMQVRNSVTRREGDGYAQKQVAAILRAVAESEMLERHLADSDADFAAMVGDAAAAVAAHLSEVERPTSLLEDDILSRLRAVPSTAKLKELYHDDRDAECARRRGLIAGLLGAVQCNIFRQPHSDEIVIDPNDIDLKNRFDLSAALSDLYRDLDRLDAGKDAKYCLAKAETQPDGYVEPKNKRDALIWAMVAIDRGAGHPIYNTQEKRCALLSEYEECAPASLVKYLQALRKGVQHDERSRFSPEEHQSFQERCARLRVLKQNGENALDLLLPVVRGWYVRKLPKSASKGKTG